MANSTKTGKAMPSYAVDLKGIRKDMQRYWKMNAHLLEISDDRLAEKYNLSPFRMREIYVGKVPHPKQLEIHELFERRARLRREMKGYLSFLRSKYEVNIQTLLHVGSKRSIEEEFGDVFSASRKKKSSSLGL